MNDLSGKLETEDSVIIGNDPEQKCRNQLKAISKEQFEKAMMRKNSKHIGDSLLADISKSKDQYFQMDFEARKECLRIFGALKRLVNDKKLESKIVMSTHFNSIYIEKKPNSKYEQSEDYKQKANKIIESQFQ